MGVASRRPASPVSGSRIPVGAGHAFTEPPAKSSDFNTRAVGGFGATLCYTDVDLQELVSKEL